MFLRLAACVLSRNLLDMQVVRAKLYMGINKPVFEEANNYSAHMAIQQREVIRFNNQTR